MQTYIYYRMNCVSESELSYVKDYFDGLGMDIRADSFNLFITSDESKRDYYEIEGDSTYIKVILKDLQPLITDLNRDIVIDGTVDTSESAGEYMDFRVIFENGTFKVLRSDWYIEACMDDFDDYEDFCDAFFDCSEDEYDKLKECEFVYLIESESGETLAETVPLFDMDVEKWLTDRK